jgi:hypothetical protein
MVTRMVTRTLAATSLLLPSHHHEWKLVVSLPLPEVYGRLASPEVVGAARLAQCGCLRRSHTGASCRRCIASLVRWNPCRRCFVSALHVPWLLSDGTLCLATSVYACTHEPQTRCLCCRSRLDGEAAPW